MRSATFAALLAIASTTTTVFAAFDPASKTNVVTYWGQGSNQDRLLTTCQNPSYDIINIGFVDVFPNQGAGGWPGTNFGNACWSDYYEHKGVNTSLLKTCPDIGPDVIECQQTYGKKILLSIGGGYPNSYYIKNNKSGVNFADFLWAAFGPVSATKRGIPRPWGDAGVDGFDFDIENLMDPAPQANYQTSGYAAMISRFKNTLFPIDKTKPYYISGAPQCTIPDSHLSEVLANSWFDFFSIQFYNTPACSARAGIQKIQKRRSKNDISYLTWTQQTSLNPNVKMSIGLPAWTDAAIDPSYYLTPAEAQTLMNKFYRNAKFGGIMLWEATAAQRNTPCGVDYGTWMKSILNAKAAGLKFDTNTDTCGGFSTKRSTSAEPAFELRKRKDHKKHHKHKKNGKGASQASAGSPASADSPSVTVSQITAEYTTVVPVSVATTINGKLWRGTYDETTTVEISWLTTVTAAPSAAPTPSSGEAAATSVTSYAVPSSLTAGAAKSSTTQEIPDYQNMGSASGQPSTYTSINRVTVVPVPKSSGADAVATLRPANGGDRGTPSPSSSSSSDSKSNGGASTKVGVAGIVFAVAVGLLLSL